jgi:tetratricopeptide (TPR) repeat protein
MIGTASLEATMLRPIALIFTLLVAGPAALADDLADCNQRTDPDRRIHSCTVLIEKGTAGNQVLSALHDFRAQAHSAKGDFDRAIADLTKAIELDATNEAPHLNRAFAHFQKSAWDLAIADFNKVVEINPRSLPAYYSRGGAYLKKGDGDQAIADYSKAIELDPTFWRAYFTRAGAYQKKGELDCAVADFTKALELEPQGH